MEIIEAFWESLTSNKTPTQLERYEKKGSPECIKRFISIGGGPKMGTTLEKYARFHFKSLEKRRKGKCETGYDHVLNGILIEQKSSGHWGEDDYKWQHIETKHKWDILLLCGIDYDCIRFWVMNRKTFNNLVEEGKITNQGNKASESSEGMWVSYSNVMHSLVEVRNDEELLAAVA